MGHKIKVYENKPETQTALLFCNKTTGFKTANNIKEIKIMKL